MEDKYQKIYYKINSLNDSLLPLAQNPSATMQDNSWELFNGFLDELVTLTKDEYYGALKVHPVRRGSLQILLASDLSIKVYQALSYLYKTQDQYLDEDTPPQKPVIKNATGQNITQNSVLTQDQQNDQKQDVQVNIEFNQTLTYMTEALVEAKQSFKENSKERKFLDTLKESITTAKTTADLIKMIAAAAVQFGITPEVLAQIFH